MLSYHLLPAQATECCQLLLKGHLFDSAQLIRRQIEWLSRLVPKEQNPLLTALAKWPSKRFIRNEQGLIVPISGEEWPQLVPLLAATGSLFFQEKRLVCDLFMPTPWELVVSPHHEQASESTAPLSLTLSQQLGKKGQPTYQVKVLLMPHPEQKRLSLSECDLMINSWPPSYIHGSILRFASRGIGKKWFNIFCQTPSLICNSDWREQIEELVHEPSDELFLRFEGCTVEEYLRPQEPLPLLKLTDRSGAFASLYMDYGDRAPHLFCRSHHLMNKDKQRKYALEKHWESDLLETGYQYKPTGSSHYYCPLPEVAKSLTFLLQLGWKLLDWRDREIVALTGCQLALHEHQEKLLLQGTLEYGPWRCDLMDCLGSFIRQEKFFAIEGGRIALLPDKLAGCSLQELSEVSQIVTEGVCLPRSSLSSLTELVNQVKNKETLSEGLSLLLSDEQLTQEIDPAPLFQGLLRPYQRRGLAWMWALYRSKLHGLLADDMGLGKTVQLLALISLIEGSGLRPPASPHLIIAPTSLLFNWESETRRFLPDCSLYLHHGVDRCRTPEKLASSTLVITSYALLRQDADLLRQINWHLVAVDEAQNIKNGRTQTARILCSLNSRFRLSMSGTPIENRLSELWSHFRFLLPELLGDESSFSKQLETASSDSRYLQRIKRRIRPFLLRRTKAEAAPDLPEKSEQTVWIEMGEEQRSFYDNFLAKARSNLLQKVRLEGTGRHRMAIFELLLRLRQLCCHPMLLASIDEEVISIPSAKERLLLNDLEQVAAEGGKVLVYSQFTSFLKLLRNQLKAKGLPYCYLDGSTKEREPIVNHFQTTDGPCLFLISLKAGGVGLNLTAADYVFIAEPWWNEAAENQAIDRAHRIGRNKPLLAKRYLIHSSIEEKMARLKNNKQALAQELIDEESSASSLLFDLEELEELLSAS